MVVVFNWVLLALTGGLSYLLYKAGKENESLRADGLEANNVILRLRAEVKKLSESLNTAGERNKELKQELEDCKKREQNRKERELRKSIHRQNDAIKQAMEEAKERKAKLAKRKRKFVKPHAINPHNPKKN